MIWRRLFARTAQAPAPVAAPMPTIDPRRFDALGTDLSPLTRQARRIVIAARKAEKTAALARVAAARLAVNNSNKGAQQ